MTSLADRSIATISMIPSAEGLRSGLIPNHAWRSHNCYFSDSNTNALVSCHRTKRNADNIGHLLMVHRYFGGGCQGYVGNDVLDRTPGPVYILDAALQWQGLREPSIIQSVYLPKSLLGYAAGQHQKFSEIPPETTLGEFLNFKLDELFGHLHHEGDYLYQSAFDEFIAYVKIAMGTNLLEGDIRSHARNALRRVICNFIERNLNDPDLSTTQVLRTFGVSRASLYRMFEAQGGVRHYIINRRALRAIIDLSNESGRRGYVREISERWGFPSAMEFSRTIRRLYNHSPGALFQTPKLSA